MPQWEPEPPSDAFVCLGMLFTTSSEPPALEAMRCVHRRWTRQAFEAPRLLWDDRGTGGRAGSLWAVNNMGHCWAVAGYQAPTRAFHELRLWPFELSEALELVAPQAPVSAPDGGEEEQEGGADGAEPDEPASPGVRRVSMEELFGVPSLVSREPSRASSDAGADETCDEGEATEEAGGAASGGAPEGEAREAGAA